MFIKKIILISFFLVGVLTIGVETVYARAAHEIKREYTDGNYYIIIQAHFFSRDTTDTSYSNIPEAERYALDSIKNGDTYSIRNEIPINRLKMAISIHTELTKEPTFIRYSTNTDFYVIILIQNEKENYSEVYFKEIVHYNSKDNITELAWAF